MKIDMRVPKQRRVGQCVQVFLDGEPVHNCVMASERSGTILCYERDAEGRLRMGNNHQPATVVRTGRVELRAGPGFEELWERVKDQFAEH